jgi:excisionase family DNA binding protein
MATKKTPADAERRLLDYPRAAAYLGISVRGFKELAAQGAVVKVPIGHRVLFDKADLDDYIKRIKKAAS